MSRSQVSLIFLTAGLSACSGSGLPPGEYTLDQRIDMAIEGAAAPIQSRYTRMCVNEQGKVYVVWMDNRTSSGQPLYDVWLNRSLNFGDEGTWLPAAVRVNQVEGNVQFDEDALDIACNNEGAYIVWTDTRDGELQSEQVYFNRYIGDEFDVNDTLIDAFDTDGLTNSLGPKITANGSELYIAWYDDRNQAYDVYVSASTDNGAEWGAPFDVNAEDPGGSYSARPQVVASGSGDVATVWEDSRDGKADIYFARSDNSGSSFKSEERLDGGEDKGLSDSFEPQLCSDGGKRITAVWHDSRNGDARDIFMNYSDDGGDDWNSSADRLDSDNEGLSNSRDPRCVVNTNLNGNGTGNTTHIIWHDKRDGAYDIYYRPVLEGIPSSNPEERVDNGPPDGFANSDGAVLAYDNGNLVVAWQDTRAEAEEPTDNGFNDLYYNYKEDGGEWQEESIRIDSVADNQSYKVEMEVAVLGRFAYFAWADGRNGSADIYFQKHELGQGGIAPVEQEQ